MPYVDTFVQGSTPYCGMLESGYEMAVQFNALVPFSKFHYVAPNLGRSSAKVTVSLYKIAESYEMTRAGAPIAESRFDFADGYMMTLECPNTPAGEYLAVAHDGELGIGFCGVLENSEKSRVWMNGVPCDGGMETSIEFDEEAEKYFGELTEIEALPAESPFDTDGEEDNTLPFTAFSCVDGLGRELPTDISKNDTRKRDVGIFYWDWAYNYCSSRGINLQKVISEHPEARNEYYSSVWMRYNAEVYHWNEPLYGFYDNCDPYVIRRQAQALADAGVDFVVLDCTNGTFVWKKGYEALLNGFEEARKDGVNVPKVVFMLNFAPFRSTWVMARQIYTDIYRKGRYKELWYFRDGKPLLICHNECLITGASLDNEILNFFTFRRNDPLYFTKEPARQDEWGWLSTYPQAKYGTRDGHPEQMTVGVAQNANAYGLVPMNDVRGGVYGRSYTYNKDYSYVYERCGIPFKVDGRTEDSKLYGLNFAEQWDYVIENDPDIVFVTGYNEWVAGRHKEWQKSPNAFPDEFNDEYSRDVEPSKGELKDHYYNQLIANIRRFKGVSPIAPTDIKTVYSIDDWDDIKGIRYYKGTAPKRDHDGYAGCHYTDDSARNTVVEMKCVYDDENVYFYAECENDISEWGEAWMNLYIRCDTTKSAWESFNFVINRTEKGSIERAAGGGWNWEKIADANVIVEGKRIMITVPRSILGLDDCVKLDYKWADNTCKDGNVLDFYTTGCVAPGERFTVPVRQ